MTFTKISDYCLMSQCKGYTVAKVFVRGVAQYDAWRGKTHLDTFVNSDLAKAACERDSGAAAMEEAA